jgi:hypothetical protein
LLVNRQNLSVLRSVSKVVRYALSMKVPALN